ncbi:MAG: hypothetical protein WAU65_01305 [Candidatus Nanoarchaeia archaeon]
MERKKLGYILRREGRDFILTEEDTHSSSMPLFFGKSSRFVGKFKSFKNDFNQYACIYEYEFGGVKKSKLIKAIENVQESPESITYGLAKAFGKQLASICQEVFSDYSYSLTSPKYTEKSEYRSPSLSTKKL